MPLNFTPMTTLNDAVVAYLTALGEAVADKAKVQIGRTPTVTSGVDSDGPFVSLTLSDGEGSDTLSIVIAYPDKVLRAALVTAQGDRLKEWKLTLAGQIPIQMMATRIAGAMFV